MAFVPTRARSALPETAAIPIFEAPRRGVDAEPWMRDHRRPIDEALSRSGAALFRGFDMADVTAFERAAAVLCGPLADDYGDLPRLARGSRVYGATPYPAELPILFHHEGSHTPRWPRRIAFFCLEPPANGGETVIADGRRVFDLLSTDLRKRFERDGLLYMRRFTPGIDVGWQAYFRTGDRGEVERRCRGDGIEAEWTADGGLRIRQRRPAVLRRGGATVFFNQILLHHPSALPADVREALAALVAEEDFPRRVAFGDGSAIPDEVVARVRAAAESEAVEIRWRRGDLLLVDNELAAHGRRSYEGMRRIAVAMAALASEKGES
jgi:alpha-ketoglutarate-dependent taurine dioxygenase